MRDKIKVCNVSKFPPYIAGPSLEAFGQAEALLNLQEEKSHQVTYHPSMYGQSTNVDDPKKWEPLIDAVVNMHYVDVPGKNLKVICGERFKTMVGQTLNVCRDYEIDVLSSFYLDPHAMVTNTTRDLLRKQGMQVITANKAVGSDVFNSIGNNLENGRGLALLLSVVDSDILYAVSEYAKKDLVKYAKQLLPQELAEEIEKKVRVSYPPINVDLINSVDGDLMSELKSKYSLDGQKVISYVGRLFPEKGVDDLIKAVGEIDGVLSDDFTLIIMGSGTVDDQLKKLAQSIGKRVIFTGYMTGREKYGLMKLSDLGVIPTKATPTFVETFCISAAEYLLTKVPLVVTRVGGVPEACGDTAFYAESDDPVSLTQTILSAVETIGDKSKLAQIVQRGYEHALQFDSLKITQQFLEDCREVIENRQK